MSQKISNFFQNRELINNSKKDVSDCVNSVRKQLLEQIRAVILYFEGKGWSHSKIGSKTGITGNYVSMLRYHEKHFPKGAKKQAELLLKFHKLLKEEGGFENE